MSEVKYAPGTVALATVWGRRRLRITRGPGYWITTDPTHEPFGEIIDDGRELQGVGAAVTDVCPLAVLDIDEPEYLLASLRNAHERLPKAGVGFGDHWALALVAEAVEAQTRSPKPAEPTGLGAVVEDADGQRWVLTVPSDKYPWCLDAGRGNYENRAYGEIDAVRVLSEGVQA